MDDIPPPPVVIIVLCMTALGLAGIWQLVCEQDTADTARCDIGFGIPIIVSAATACVLLSLAVLALSQD